MVTVTDQAWMSHCYSTKSHLLQSGQHYIEPFLAVEYDTVSLWVYWENNQCGKLSCNDQMKDREVNLSTYQHDKDLDNTMFRVFPAQCVGPVTY